MNLIVNVSENWAIGRGNELLFHLSTDMKFFKSQTIEKTVVMGRKTLESFPGKKPLPKRKNIVLTTNPDFCAENVEIIHSIDELLKKIDLENSEDIYVIGGETIYRQLLPYCDTAFVTKVASTVNDADAFMVNLDDDENWEIADESETMNEKGYDFKFVTYKKKAI
ncbi:MAG: dihydrofolate reductase [Clostridia bacterium]|jgi:dihydrofolate reductase|nr:dihydrofolate reductase [Clostridia bacterium]